MVYESDFYTTRRPYSSRPVVSSYSVTTPLRIIPTGFSRVQTYTSSYPIYSSYPTVIHRSIPFVAHKRIVTATRISATPTRIVRSPSRVIASPMRIVNVRVRPSVINRRVIEHKVRSHPHYYATENYLNSSYAKDFDDETRDLRTATNSLLRKVHTNVQRAHSVSPISYSSKYEQRYGTDAYLAKALGSNKISEEINREINTKYNVSDSNRKYVGKSHLASVRIVGDKGYSKRSQIIPTTPLFFRKDKVRKDINFLSFYKKNIAAADAHQAPTFSLPSAKLDPNRASRKFTQPKPLEDPNVELKEKQAARFDRLNALGDDDEIALEKKKAQRLEAAKQLEQKALEEEIVKKAEQAKRDEEARRAELDRQEKLAAQAAAERAAELERKAEEERAIREAEEAQAAEEARVAAEARAAEDARIVEEARVAEEARAAEEARIAEEARVAEEARLAEETRLAEEARKAEEQAREEQRLRLAELEKIAEEEKEAELARQAAELAEIARQQEEEAQRIADEEKETELARQAAESETQDDSANEPADEEIAAEETTEPEVQEEAPEDQIVSEPVVDEPASPVESQEIFKSGSEAEEQEEAEEEEDE